jgi:hypothetical protein
MEKEHLIPIVCYIGRIALHSSSEEAFWTPSLVYLKFGKTALQVLYIIAHTARNTAQVAAAWSHRRMILCNSRSQHPIVAASLTAPTRP